MENSWNQNGPSEDLHARGTPNRVSGDAVILEMAMRKEDYSVKLYQALFEFVHRDDSKTLLKHLIADERKHFSLLREAMVTGNYDKVGVPLEAESLEMTDYLLKEDLRRSATPQEIVKMAIRREEESEEFYLSRVPLVQAGNLRDLYQRLAREETNHREKLLKGYDDLILMRLA